MSTTHRKNHEATLLSLLSGREWICGSALTRESGTTNLSARLSGLKAQGYLIESETQEGSDFKKYRLRGKGKPQEIKRTQLVIKVPPNLSAAEIEELEQELEEHAWRFSQRNPDLSLSLFDEEY